MRKRIFVTTFLALLISALMIAVACQKQAAPADTREAAQTAAQSAASIPGRVISAAPSNTEIIAGLGLAERLIAVDHYSKDIEGVRPDLPEVDFFYPDAEAVIGLEPDIIIANEINNFGAADSPFKPLAGAGIKVVQIPTSTSLEGICGDILTIAEALGVEERGETLAASLRAGINRIAETGRTIEEKDKKRVYFEVAPAPGMVTLGSGTYINEMIEIIGAENIFSGQRGWFSPSGEAVLEGDPEVILTLAVPGSPDPALELRNRAGFQTISAVRENRIYAIDGNSAGRPSQNIILALKQMAQAVYPDLYAAD
jgi:iron complex transport system substrate-binding protein